MFRDVCLLATTVVLSLGLAPSDAAGAESTPSTRAVKNATPKAEPRLTPEDIERMRQQSWKKPKYLEPENIESITAEAYSHFLPVADVPPFVVPKKYYGDLLKHFQDAELDKIADPLNEELGTIRMGLVGGRSIRICWFWSGQGDRLCFSWCGMRYRATGDRFAKDETLAIDSLVRRIYRIEVMHEDGKSEPIDFRQRK
jgi:hypothetical protein